MPPYYLTEVIICLSVLMLVKITKTSGNIASPCSRRLYMCFSWINSTEPLSLFMANHLCSKQYNATLAWGEDIVQNMRTNTIFPKASGPESGLWTSYIYLDKKLVRIHPAIKSIPAAPTYRNIDVITEQDFYQVPKMTDKQCGYLERIGEKWQMNFLDCSSVDGKVRGALCQRPFHLCARDSDFRSDTNLTCFKNVASKPKMHCVFYQNQANKHKSSTCKLPKRAYIRCEGLSTTCVAKVQAGVSWFSYLSVITVTVVLLATLFCATGMLLGSIRALARVRYAERAVEDLDVARMQVAMIALQREKKGLCRC